MADGGLSVAVPGDNDNEDDAPAGVSLNGNFDDDDDDVERQQAGLNSPKLGAPANAENGGATPNTLRNQYGVNSPRKKGDIPKGGWAAANEDDKSGNAGASAGGGGGGGLQSLVTQVSREDPTAQIIAQVPKDDGTQQTLEKQTTQQSSGFCACLGSIFGCCSPSQPAQQNSTQMAQAKPAQAESVSTIPKSKPQDPLIPVQKKKDNGDDDKEDSYTETEYPPGILPPLLPEHVGKKCLVLDLDETLVHSSFKPIPNPDFIIPVEIDNVVHRVYVMKRPFVDEFLIECAKDYEVVIFTASLAKYADPLLDKLDPHQTITHRLFRESCVLHGTAYVKDLRTLGRKLRDSIIVDNSPPSYLFQPINAIPILSWFDDQTDTQLRDIMPCLKTTLKNIKDVRKILDANTKSYRWLCQQANKPLELFE